MVAIPGMGLMAVSYAEAAKRTIQRELSYLKLDEPGIERFVADYSKNKSSNYQLKVRSLYLMHASSEQSGVVNEMVQDYLLATDFFRNKMDEQRTVQYVGLYDPYKTPCANPFSFLYFPPHLS